MFSHRNWQGTEFKVMVAKLRNDGSVLHLQDIPTSRRGEFEKFSLENGNPSLGMAEVDRETLLACEDHVDQDSTAEQTSETMCDASTL